MDWYSWLSQSALDPSLVSEYALLLSRNELEEGDIPYFDHEFLQSMGISIAKHRLEILKLAKKQPTPRPVARLLSAILKTKKCLARYLRSLVHHDSSAIMVVPRSHYGGGGGGGGRWRGALLKRSKRVVMLKQRRLLLTDGVAASGQNPVVYSCVKSYDDDGGVWKSGGEEIRWDSMFQDLKPT